MGCLWRGCKAPVERDGRCVMHWNVEFLGLPRRVAPIKRTRLTSCAGCGKIGKFLCRDCKEWNDAVRRRVAKLWGTLENRFAARRA